MFLISSTLFIILYKKVVFIRNGKTGLEEHFLIRLLLEKIWKRFGKELEKKKNKFELL